MNVVLYDSVSVNLSENVYCVGVGFLLCVRLYLDVCM